MTQETQKKIPRNTCIRCGTCCLKGGPVLHHEDKKLLRAGHIGYQHLITIRKGEMAFDPVLDRLKPVSQEFIKVRGKGDKWSCCFYDEKNSSCNIYRHRFLECRLLKCWAPSDLLRMIGKNTIVRADIINPDDPIMRIIEIHEQECPYHEVENLITVLSKKTDRSKNLEKLTKLVRKDLSIRLFAKSELELKAEFELFIFGRPLYKVLSDRCISVNIQKRL